MSDDLQRKLDRERHADMDAKSRALGGPGLPPYPSIPTQAEGGEMTGSLGGTSSRNFPQHRPPADAWRRGE